MTVITAIKVLKQNNRKQDINPQHMRDPAEKTLSLPSLGWVKEARKPILHKGLCLSLLILASKMFLLKLKHATYELLHHKVLFLGPSTVFITGL